MPEDNSLSSGTSYFRGNMVKFNNYENALNYAYVKNKRIPERDTTLNEKSFYFWDEIDYLNEEGYYPQGLCFTEDYVLVSLYSDKVDSLGVVKIFNKKTGEYLLSLGMDKSSHMGGIAYDGKNIWICNSDKMQVERIEYSFMIEMISACKGEIVDVRNLVEVYPVKNKPSCITYYDGMVWVATHSILKKSIVMAYHYNERENTITRVMIFNTPSKVQGISFSETGEVYLSVSYGRRNSSYVQKYINVEMMSKNKDSYMEKIELPPCSEGIVIEDDKVYVLFESAGTKYLQGADGKGKSIAPLNRILVIENKKGPLYQ